MTTVEINTISEQPRKGVSETYTDNTPTIAFSDLATTGHPTITFETTATRLADSMPTSTAEVEVIEDDDDDGNLSPGAERALIAISSIGSSLHFLVNRLPSLIFKLAGVILLCFIGWLVYRTAKRSRQRHLNGIGRGLSAVLPGRGTQDGRNSWGESTVKLTGDGTTIVDEKNGLRPAEAEGYWQSGNNYSSGTLAQPGSAGTKNLSDDGLGRLNPPGGQFSRPGSEAGSAMGPRPVDSYPGQPELARQPSDAYDSVQRNMYRASELSSLSSGFGDGDIIVPDSLSKPPEATAQPLPRQSSYLGRFSWMSRRASARDTIFTNTSEDRPARFRTVSSWVNQQAGRVRRAEERRQAEGEIPAVPDMPDLPDLPGQNGVAPPAYIR